VDRRNFVGLLFGSALAAPRLALAQQKPVIGFLSARSSVEAQHVLQAFRDGLKDGGFVEGKNVAIEYRWADGEYDRLKPMATDLAARRVNLIAATGGTPSAIAAKHSTSTIPIVFTAGGDPVKLGLVASLNRPGGNVTGASQLAGSLEGKKLELLSSVVPNGTIGALLNEKSPNLTAVTRDLEDAARTLGRRIQLVHASSEKQFEAVFTALAKGGCKAVLLMADPFFDVWRTRLVALSTKHALPGIYAWREYPEAGGLMSYGTNIKDAYRLVGLYAGRILKGEKPAEMPVQAAKVEFVINRKVAKAQGIAIPQNLLLRADHIID
jgi:putative ABC transport system substrate-binding protein